MAAVRPPAGGQSLKQNYDLDQVRSYDSTMIQSKNACRIRGVMLNVLQCVDVKDLGRSAHRDRAGVPEALHVQDEVGLLLLLFQHYIFSHIPMLT